MSYEMKGKSDNVNPFSGKHEPRPEQFILSLQVADCFGSPITIERGPIKEMN